MRTFSQVILSLSFVFIVGCSTAEKEKPYTIGFAQCTHGDDWRKAMLEGMEKELSFHPQVKLLMKDAHDDSQLQIQQIRELVASKIDLLIISPNEAQPITPVVEEVFNQGIPVIIVDRRTNSKLFTAYVGGDNLQIGQTAGLYVGELLQKQGKVLEITGTPSASAASERHQAFSEALRKYPGIELMPSLNGDWERPYVMKRLPEVLKKNPDVNLIFAQNDRMALGAYQVCKALGIEHQVKIVGVDGLSGPKGGLQFVEDGIFKATLLYPTGGEEAIRTALKILDNEPYAKENILGTLVIDSSNVHILKQQSEKIVDQRQDIQKQQVRIEEQNRLYDSQQTVLYILGASLLTAVVFAGIAYKSLRSNRRITQQLKNQNEEISAQRNTISELAEQARQSTEAKLGFFTNFSHELRTPLTLILGPIDELLAAAPTGSNQRKDLEVIQRNARWLLKLINQLIDFRKIEVGKMPLRVAQYDLVSFTRTLLQAFEKTAQQRGIHLRFLPADALINAWFDANLLDKVIVNLVSNAFKFTPDHGSITIVLQTQSTDDTIRLMVEDTGPGLSEEQQKRVFEWFYQGNESASVGSGIGLALAKELIQLHHGTIGVRSQLGKGSSFEISLPAGKPVYAQDEVLPEPSVADPDWTTGELVPEVESTSNPQAASVLLIEDNLELRTFLTRKLKPHFQVLEAADGSSGLNTAIDALPDLIVSDVMMPGTSGVNLVDTLKQDWRTSHIPIVLLTARTAQEQQLEGVQAGADLYLTKPFDPTFLLESLKTLLRNRQLVREHFRRELSIDTTVPASQKVDRKFIQELGALVEKNVNRSDLSVEELARDMGLSRVQLYRKVKALLDCGVTDFIQNIRLTKARELLATQSITIAEVAYQVGFSSPTYFSTAFKAKYNISPSDFKNLHQKN
ncbi:substrate-binding domain-containing protein [Siphonobacter sp. SORGH_AS_0500]|uniref:hybrid sensor histidine kinase/response regulator transcription factor n=1 Tax=Siphonobacter sp. SORGH_AS_0500 TaxID=1864824 RepID=UPI002861B4E3|nr:substrate-binding domain-containing protein [Siphonobacter sp. SORGH_AS_0500]MDR6197785.1 signal transduction histidine kinase/DNA-binding response OmpR family regulator [Siphonobacter sp. SORGH_AS_0500]